MTRKYLESRGWRCVREPHWVGDAQLWDHDDHQHHQRGFFMRCEAEAHQRSLDKGETCLCTKRSGGKP